MLKFERYIHGFSILRKVFIKSEGVLAIGGMAATCILVFASTLMYYAERNNRSQDGGLLLSQGPCGLLS